MMITFNLVGLASTLNSLDKCGGGMKDKIRKAVDKKAEDIRGDMVGLAPVGITGKLSGSIRIATIKDEGDIYILAVGPSDDLESGIPGKPYSIFQEFGTMKMGAQEFVGPAAEMNKPLSMK